MGLLKHFVLPFFTVVHTFVSFSCYVGDRAAGRAGIVKGFDWSVNSVDTPDGGLTMYEQHAFGIIGGAHASLGFAAMMGVVHEHSHFRAVVATMEVIFWTLGGVDAALLGFPCVAAYIFAGMAAVGLAVHMIEPGLVTRDKDAGKKRG